MNHIDRIEYLNDNLILPIKKDFLTNKEFDYKVFLILKLIAAPDTSNIIAKDILIENKDRILEEFNIKEKNFATGINKLIKLGALEVESNYYKIAIKKLDGYYLTLYSSICLILAKESSRIIKLYLFIRNYLKDSAEVFNNAKGIINYNIMSKAIGYKDIAKIKKDIYRLIELNLIQRTEIKQGYKSCYKYEVYNATIEDYI